MTHILQSLRTKLIATVLITLFSFSYSQAGELSPDLQVKLDIYKTKLGEWAERSRYY